MEQEVFNLISESLGCSINEINMNSGLLNHYKWDSLAHIEIIIKIEEYFNLVIPEDLIEELNNIEKIVAYLKKNNYE